jgi:argininosuccinate synthase
VAERVVPAYSGGLTAEHLDQSMAKGFIEPWSLPSKIAARRDQAAK